VARRGFGVDGVSMTEGQMMSIDELQPTKRARAGKGAQVKADAKFLRGAKFAKASAPGKAVKKQNAVERAVTTFEKAVKALRIARKNYTRVSIEFPADRLAGDLLGTGKSPGMAKLTRAEQRLEKCRAKCDAALLAAQCAIAERDLLGATKSKRGKIK
jgi:hypothetical protein